MVLTDRVIFGDAFLVGTLPQSQQLVDLLIGAATVQLHRAFDDFAVTAAEELIAVLIRGHRPAEMDSE